MKAQWLFDLAGSQNNKQLILHCCSFFRWQTVRFIYQFTLKQRTDNSTKLQNISFLFKTIYTYTKCWPRNGGIRREREFRRDSSTNQVEIISWTQRNIHQVCWSTLQQLHAQMLPASSMQILNHKNKRANPVLCRWTVLQYWARLHYNRLRSADKCTRWEWQSSSHNGSFWDLFNCLGFVLQF